MTIPEWVVGFESFRRWLHSDEFPKNGKICFINNSIWVDLSMEEFFAHGQVWLEISRVLANLDERNKIWLIWHAKELATVTW